MDLGCNCFVELRVDAQLLVAASSSNAARAAAVRCTSGNAGQYVSEAAARGEQR